MKKLPDGRLAHRLSPRRKGSHWTKLNKERCRDLERRGLIDGRTVSYEDSELDELTLAYATTIHKSQGSEYPVVIIPLLMTHFVMLQRNLVYTGITRAKRLCILVGTTKPLAYAIHNQTVQKRNTRLKERLHQS